MKKKKEQSIQQKLGIRLNVPCHKIIMSKKMYKRREKHKRDYE